MFLDFVINYEGNINLRRTFKQLLLKTNFHFEYYPKNIQHIVLRVYHLS